jgi:hypothetical protein
MRPQLHSCYGRRGAHLMLFSHVHIGSSIQICNRSWVMLRRDMPVAKMILGHYTRDSLRSEKFLEDRQVPQRYLHIA